MASEVAGLLAISVAAWASLRLPPYCGPESFSCPLFWGEPIGASIQAKAPMEETLSMPLNFRGSSAESTGENKQRSKLRTCSWTAISMFGLCLLIAAFGASIVPKLFRFRWTTQTLAISSPVCGYWEYMLGKTLTPNSAVDIQGVASSSTDDMWVVGTASDLLNNPATFILHWNGKQLDEAPGPNPKAENLHINGVVSLSRSDAWAVGSDTGRTIILHWDGKAWLIEPSQNANNSVNELSSVAAITSDDVWAAGFYHSNYRQPLLEHWNGTTWELDSSFRVTAESKLYGLTAISSNDVWAVGYSESMGRARTLTAHWDGQNWARIESPNLCKGNNSLVSISGISSNDVWAVGNCADDVGSPSSTKSLILHWNGVEWRLQPSPSISQSNYLSGVKSVSSNNVWAVGFSGVLRSSGKTLVIHWDGAKWTQVQSPNPTNGIESFIDVTVSSENDIWAVGASEELPLVAHLKLSECATPVATLSTMP